MLIVCNGKTFTDETFRFLINNRKVISLNTFISYMAYRIYKHKLYCKFIKLNKLQYT